MKPLLILFEYFDNRQQEYLICLLSRFFEFFDTYFLPFVRIFETFKSF